MSLDQRGALVAKLATAGGEAAAPVDVASVPNVPAAAPAAVPVTAPSAPPVPTVRTPAPAWTFVAPPVAPKTSLSLQSVLAVAGAGLVAVAAIVFAFFNPDLDSFEARTAIIAASTLVFLGAAWLLARGTLQFSAEAVGALGTVFVGLDVWAFTEPAASISGTFLLASLGTLVSSVALVGLGYLAKLRAWVWIGFVGLPIALVFAGFGIDLESWGPVIGFIGAGAIALVVHPVVSRLSARFSSPLQADHVTAFVIQQAAFFFVIVLLPFSADGVERSVGSTIALATLAAIAAASARNLAPAWWSWATGALFASSLLVLAFGLPLDDGWMLALAPFAVLVAVALSAAVRAAGGLSPSLVRAGIWSVAVVAVIPSLVTTLPVVMNAALAEDLVSSVSPTMATAMLIGLLVSAGSHILLRRVGRRDQPPSVLAPAWTPIAVWLVATAVVLFATFPVFARITHAILCLVIAVGLAFALAYIPWVRERALTLTSPLYVAAHILVIVAASASWNDEALRVPLGAASIGVLALLARAMPRPVRPVYTAVGYSWALILLSAALVLADLELIAVLCLTTSVAALVALVTTITHWPRIAHWYAILIVTSVPFLIGVGTVFFERSGWTGLSTSVIVGLLLVVLFSRREGLTRFLRTSAAALVVPAVSVAVISLAAQFLAVSASPITLPIIASIVACVLPATNLVGVALQRLGVSDVDARSARIALEISSLVTAAVAVLLALVRAAAGLPTTLIVLVILGAGAVATALFARRRYGWPLAGIAFTGALWCLWALNGVTGLEPYLLPPTLGAAVVGLFLVARGLPGFGLSATGLYAAGLTTALAPILVTLVAVGSEGLVPWRTWLLLAFAAGLTLFAALIPVLTRWRWLSRIGSLRMPSLFVALIAAASGVVQSVRFALSLDGASAGDPGVMWLVLAYTLTSTVIAIAIGVLVSRRSDATWSAPERLARSRWLFVPAVVFLVGPITAMRSGWLPIITLLTISMALLALMIVTAALARTRSVVLPPVVVTFAAAWSAAVASWSARDLRVEAYSLPLGFALLAVGVIALWPQREERGTFWSWPIGYKGSWRLLAPGIVVIFLPSILATGTDPRTERAILVIVLALVAIMIGNLRRLAAPFILGIIVLPIENIMVFAVQVGRNIGAQPWWITLATAGAVLLVLAVTSERRVGQGKGAAARMRDLT
ncbi:hypothetical protein HDC94_002065 [Leifsonia sp. AK011]|uniref:SCO7613 C-terminal domain-containing membrane protein n=1 Tax=Leifsonia sp. AK011 TaxID=2723075 RepID=UPI0015CD6136|nr:hypothetical protein [Leifsonia sp. AK011]NYF10909.1 hypothetical protein [Leifsonia sp. AK011]